MGAAVNSDAQRPLSKAAIEAAWQRIRTTAGIADVRLHDLSHTVSTYAGQSGANAFLVRDLLRHKNLAMTGRYVNRADDPVRTLSDQVGERIAAGLAGRKGGKVVPLKREAYRRHTSPDCQWHQASIVRAISSLHNRSGE